MSENEFVGNVSSFFEHSPSEGTVSTVTPCEIIIISRKSWELFCNKIPNWETTFQEIINKVLIKKQTFKEV